MLGQAPAPFSPTKIYFLSFLILPHPHSSFPLFFPNFTRSSLYDSPAEPDTAAAIQAYLGVRRRGAAPALPVDLHISPVPSHTPLTP